MAESRQPERPGSPRPDLPEVSESQIAALGQLGEYRLLEKLGEGGMGVVYRALHVELERIVALKVIRSDRVGDSQAVERFRREIKAAGRLEHPHIVLAHDARQIDGTYFLVMEYIDGLDLAEMVEHLGPLPIAESCEAIRQAAAGLHFAHQHELIHRDVKPSNLMLARNGTIKLLDLGLARLQSSGPAAEGATIAGLAIGTPDYMAPEQTSDSRSVDGRSDVYGLGCTLYALLTGEPPFGGPRHRQTYEKMMAHVHEPPVPLRDCRAEVPQGLEAVVQRMLAKEPKDRYATAAEVAEALAEFASGSDLPGLLGGVIGRPPTQRVSAVATPRGAKPTRQKIPWRWIGLAATILVGLAVWFGFRSSDPARPENQTAKNTPAAAEAEELPGWIVLSWTLQGIGKPDLWLFRPDGSERVQVTADPQQFDVHPCFSPDGGHLAFVRGTNADQSTSLWVCRSDGEDARELVAPETEGQRILSPAWLSDSVILYVLDPRLDRMPDMELWRVDLDDGSREIVFPLRDVSLGGTGMVTDVSPDGDRLALVLQHRNLWPTANIYVGNLDGDQPEVVWQDLPDQCKDARALWSPDGRQIAWHHNFTQSLLAKQFYYGIGLAEQAEDGSWRAQLQPRHDVQVTPLAWAPDGRGLLCAEMSDDESRATLLLIDDQFHPVATLFDLEVHNWQPGRQDLGRLADWAVVPDDLPIPPR